MSVILPIYNGEDYVRCAIDSVLGQTFQNFELIVVDDGSTDSTPEIVRAYGDRVRYVRQENGGVASAFNHGLRLAAGRYISWLSHDDVFLPAKLEMQVRAVSNLNLPAVSYTDVQFINAQGEVTEEREIKEHAPGEVLRNLVTAGPVGYAAYSLFYDKRCIDEVGFYDEAQPMTQDADMLIRLARRFPFVRVPQKLIQIREHGGRASLNERWKREAFKLYSSWLEELSIEELFPELGERGTRAARARARVWLGDKYAGHSMAPFGRLAIMQYLNAFRESPVSLPSVASRIAGFCLRHLKPGRQFYRIGLRTALARRFGDSPRQGKV